MAAGRHRNLEGRHATLHMDDTSLAGGFFVAWAALRQAGIAARRHYAQTDADRERRITENFSGAVEQRGSEKLATRLGGIYTLERLSRESERKRCAGEGEGAQRLPPLPKAVEG